MYIYIILIYFKIIVSRVCSNPPSPYAVFKSLHLHWHICHKSIKSSAQGAAPPPPKVPPYLIFTLFF